MERNRPWILQHLTELFTPRTLAAQGNDGRPNSEYVRDLYHELMNMGEGRRLQGDRSDISSDSEDDLEKMRRQWSNVPVDGASKDIALYWQARAGGWMEKAGRKITVREQEELEAKVNEKKRRKRVVLAQ
ncbi:hypothetical protein FI667_g3678, partial [Globisporangium splendens]